MAFKQAWTDSTLGPTVSVTVSVAAGDVLVAWLVEDTNPAGDSVNPSNWPSGFTHVHAIDTLACPGPSTCGSSRSWTSI